MEISGIINNLEDFNQISSDKSLDLIFEDLSKFSLEDFSYIEYVDNIEHLKIMDLFRKSMDEIYFGLEDNSIEKNVAIVKSLIKIFKKGVNEINLVYFFIFLHANSQINLSINHLVIKYNLNDEFSQILIKLFEFFVNIKIQMVNESLFEYSENDFDNEETLIDFLRRVDFEKNAPLIKNNKFILPIHFYQMIEVLQIYNFELFEKLLAIDNIFTLVILIKCMSFNQINSFFANHDKIKEKTLLCFLMKFLKVNSKNKNNYYDMIVNISIQLYNLNHILFKELMYIFMYNEFFNEIIGSMLCKLSKEDINIILEAISLNNNIHLINRKDKMLNKCNECENFVYILELIHSKWKIHLLNSFNEKERFVNILCTDFCNFIVSFYFHKLDNDNLLYSMKELFIKLKNLDSEWSYNFIQHRNKFFVYYSKLFILSVLYKFNNLIDDEIKELYNDFYHEYVEYKNFFDKTEENFLKEFEVNLLNK